MAEISARSGAHLLTAEEVAERFQVRPTFIYYLARTGQLPCVKLGQRYVRFRLDSIEEFERNGGAA